MKGSGTVRVGSLVTQEVGRVSQELAGAPRPAGEAQGERECRGKLLAAVREGRKRGEACGIRCVRDSRQAGPSWWAPIWVSCSTANVQGLARQGLQEPHPEPLIAHVVTP